MNRNQTEHGLRAAMGVTDENRFYVLGTASILATHPTLPESVVSTHEVDLWPVDHPEKSEVLECIGEGSVFHSTHGFYLDPFNPHSIVLPQGWESRLVPIKNDNTHGCEGLCLEPHDLMVSKLARGEEKDLAFISEMIRRDLVSVDTIQKRMAEVPEKTLRYQQSGESPLQNIRIRLQKNLATAVEKANTTSLPASKGIQRLLRRGIAVPENYPESHEQEDERLKKND